MPDASADVILSNCVINLSPDKAAVFREAFRVLKHGGRLAISDVVATATMPKELAASVEAVTGCVSGAAPIDTLKGLLVDAGFEGVNIDPRAGSREIIGRCMPGAEDFVASAVIEGRKRGGPASCCAPSCCEVSVDARGRVLYCVPRALDEVPEDCRSAPVARASLRRT